MRPNTGRSFIWNGTAWSNIGDGNDQTQIIVRKTTDQSVANSTVLVNDTQLSMNIGANEQWVIQYNLSANGPTAADFKFAVTAPAGATCSMAAYDPEGATAQANIGCGVASGLIAASGVDDPLWVSVIITNGAAAGVVNLQWSQFSANGTANIVRAGSYLTAFRIRGADLAEVYYTSDTTASEGDIVSLAGNGVSQVQKSVKGYDSKALGIISTKPGLVMGAADGTGKPVIVGLSGRVPVKVSTKNGDIQPGDYITTSDIPGVGMRATRAGHVIGKALTGFAGGAEGTVMVFIQNTYFDGNYDDVITATGTLTTDGTGTTPTPTYSILGSTLVSSPVITTSTTTPTALVPVSQSVAENDADYLAALTNTARDVKDTIIGAIMTGVHLIRDLIVLQVTALRGYFDQIWTRETHTETLCVGTTGNETCITKEQLDALLHMAVSASGMVVVPEAPPSTTAVILTPTTPTTSGTSPIEPLVTPTVEPTASNTTSPEAPTTIVSTTEITSSEVVVTSPSPSVEITPVVEVAPTVTEAPVITETPTVTDMPVVTVP